MSDIYIDQQGQVVELVEGDLGACNVVCNGCIYHGKDEHEKKYKPDVSCAYYRPLKRTVTAGSLIKWIPCGNKIFKRVGHTKGGEIK